MRQSKMGDYMGTSDPSMSDNLKRRYGKPPSIKSEIDHMVEKYTPDSVNSFRERLDDFIRRTADRLLGENRSNPEKNLYKELQNDKEKSLNTEQ